MKRIIYAASLLLCLSVLFSSCEKSGTENGKDDEGGTDAFGAVDLGLSVKWASCNLGASKPSEVGDFYRWGDTTPWKEGSGFEDYKFYTGRSFENLYATNSGNYVLIFSKYNLHPEDDVCTDNKTTLDPEDDAAHVKLGGRWRIPTSKELSELCKNCTYTEEILDGQRGFVFKSSKNGNTIFLPIDEAYGDWETYYMSSSLYTTNYYWFVQEQEFAWCLPIVHGKYDMGVGREKRYSTFTIRPVCD